ncbi:MAG: 2-keto-4-pentenoate hydratase [Candidatus Nanopelagicales bacterium]
MPGIGAAYAVQEALTELRLQRGGRVVGWKLGYTSAVMREQMGVPSPNLGPLLTSMILDGVVGEGFVHPRVEPEIALVLDRDPGPDADVDHVLACCSGARVALEVVDSVWTGYRFDLEHNTADGSSAAGVVLGPAIPLDRLDEVRVTMTVDGEAAGSGAGADASGHPAAGVAWLASELAARRRHLRYGDVVITGGLTAAAPLHPGSRAEAVFVHPVAGATSVSVMRAGEPR